VQLLRPDLLVLSKLVVPLRLLVSPSVEVLVMLVVTLARVQQSGNSQPMDPVPQ
jgi:hypothetical protein